MKKKQYLTFFINQIVSSILIGLYLLAIWVADANKVNLLLFRQSLICFILNIMLYISFVTLFVFRTCIFGYVALRILYPFKHQCIWLKWVSVVTVIIWIFATLTYIFCKFFMFSKQTKLHFDNFCSIGWCVGLLYNGVNIFHLVLYGIFHLSLISHIIVASKVYTFLKNHQRNVPASNNRYSAIVVTCKLITSNLSEIIFMMYLAVLLTFKLSNNLPNDYYCLNLFLYAMPVSTCHSGIIYIFK